MKNCNCEGNIYNIGMGCCQPVVANPNAYYTKSEVDEKIDESLLDYYNKEEIDGFVSDLEASDSFLSGQVGNLSTAIETEAQRAISSEQSLSNDIEAVDNKLDLKADADSVYTKSEVDTALSNKLDVTAYTPTDLSNYYTKKETDTNIDEATNNIESWVYKQGFVTEDALDNYYTKNDVISAITPSNSGSTLPISTNVVAENEKVVASALNELNKSLNQKQDTLTVGSGLTMSNNVISAKIWNGTRAQYDALENKDADCIYLIYIE